MCQDMISKPGSIKRPLDLCFALYALLDLKFAKLLYSYNLFPPQKFHGRERGGGAERERETDRQTDRETETETEIETERQRQTETDDDDDDETLFQHGIYISKNTALQKSREILIKILKLNLSIYKFIKYAKYNT